MKRCQISGNSSLHAPRSDPAAWCTLPTIWTFETQTSNPPFFYRPAVRALSVILSELCLSIQSVAVTWPSLHNALREEEAATGWRVCQTHISQHQVPRGLFAPGVNAGQWLFYDFVTQQTMRWGKIFPNFSQRPFVLCFVFYISDTLLHSYHKSSFVSSSSFN